MIFSRALPTELSPHIKFNQDILRANLFSYLINVGGLLKIAVNVLKSAERGSNPRIRCCRPPPNHLAICTYYLLLRKVSKALIKSSCLTTVLFLFISFVEESNSSRGIITLAFFS